jgi:hypothetical protein
MFYSIRYARKQKDVADFERTIKKLRTAQDLESTFLIETFDKAKKAIIHEVTSATSTLSVHESQKMVRKLQEELEKVIGSL